MFCGVTSGVAFLFGGAVGVRLLLDRCGWRAVGAFVGPSERWPYLILFLSVAMACFGSGYYHLMPNNDRLL